MNRQFAINLRDGRVVLCTRETFANIDYYAISEKVALAIESGVLDRMDVVAKVKGKLLTSEKEWDSLLQQKTTQNMRHSPISVDTAEKSETVIAKDEVKDEFDMPVPEEEPVAKAHKKPVAKAADKAADKADPFLDL